MDVSVKLAIYFLIIGSELDRALSRPTRRIPNVNGNYHSTILTDERRKRRQVVQPTWLLDGGILPGDTKVRVTEQNLKEAAAIRKSIQSAVDAGTFAVDISEPHPVIPVVENSEDANKPQPKPIFFPPFDFSKFDFSQWNKNIFKTEQQDTFTAKMRRVWQEFVDNSKKWLNFNNT